MRQHRYIASLVKIMLVFGAVGFCAPSFADSKIGVVNVRRVVEECTEGKSIISKLKGEAEKKQKEFQESEATLKSEYESLMKQESVLTPEALQKKRTEFQQKADQLRESAMKAQKDLTDKEASLTKPLQDKILRIIASVAQDGKYSMILHADAVLYQAQPEHDLTNEVIRKINASR